MCKFAIVTDSCCDLPAGLAREMDLSVINLSVRVEDQTFVNHLDWREVSAGDFYGLLRAQKSSSTSAPSLGDYLQGLEPLLEQGRDVLVLSFSSALSSTAATAAMAAQELADRYPQRKILCVDSLCASLGQGLFVRLVWEKQQEGCTLEEAAGFARELIPHLCHWFTVNDLFFLHRGGRVSKTTAVLGSALQIKPVMHVDDEGRLIKIGTARGRKGSIIALKDHLKETIIYPEDQVIYISHGDCEAEARQLADLIAAEVPVKGFVFNHVGPVIGSHSGPGTIALFHVGTHR